MREATKAAIEKMLNRQGHGQPGVIIPDGVQLDHDLGLDSYDKLELILMLETEFNINILDDHFDPEMTFGQLVDKIEAIRDKA